MTASDITAQLAQLAQGHLDLAHVQDQVVAAGLVRSLWKEHPAVMPPEGLFKMELPFKKRITARRLDRVVTRLRAWIVEHGSPPADLAALKLEGPLGHDGYGLAWKYQVGDRAVAVFSTGFDGMQSKDSGARLGSQLRVSSRRSTRSALLEHQTGWLPSRRSPLESLALSLVACGPQARAFMPPGGVLLAPSQRFQLLRLARSAYLFGVLALAPAAFGETRIVVDSRRLPVAGRKRPPAVQSLQAAQKRLLVPDVDAARKGAHRCA